MIGTLPLGTAHAQPSISEVPLPTPHSNPLGIAVGLDGNLWFTEQFGNKIGRITPTGIITEFPIPTAASGPGPIAAGPDGNLWFAESTGHRIGRISPAGVITEFPVPAFVGSISGITAGPDGNLWFTEWGAYEGENKIGRMTPLGELTPFTLLTGGGAEGIAAGPDGNLWFLQGWRIGRITPAGVITFYDLPGLYLSGLGLTGITAGPDGNLWFTETVANAIGRITPAGDDIIEFPLPTPNGAPFGITVGSDGNLWFAGFDRIGRVTTAGVITEFPIPTGNAEGRGIALGSDGNLWFAEYTGNKIGRAALSGSPPPIVETALVSTGTGAGGGAHVRLFQVAIPSGEPTPLGGGFFAYDPGFTGGVQATLVQAGGDLIVVTGVGSGGGPHIKLFKVMDLTTGAVQQLGGGFMAYDPGFTGGARVAATTDTAGNVLIITGVGPGGGPHVKLFRVTDLATGTVTQLGGGFFPYDPGFLGGVNVGGR
jgi:streptogramin lyase